MGLKVTVENAPLFSVIVPTVDRVAELEALLDSLECQHFRDFETIIIDQNDDDRVAELLARRASDGRVRHLRQAHRNACDARNQGAALAAGSWLDFADDDCVFDPGTLATAAAALRQRPAKIVAGMVLAFDGSRLIHLPGRTTRLTRFWAGATAEACLFIRRDVFDEVGGFDPDFGPGGRYHASEGLELLLRLLPRTGRDDAWIIPDIIVRHPRKIPPYDMAALRRAACEIGTGVARRRHRSLPVIAWEWLVIARILLKLLSPAADQRAFYAARLQAIRAGHRLEAARWRVQRPPG